MCIYTQGISKTQPQSDSRLGKNMRVTGPQDSPKGFVYFRIWTTKIQLHFLILTYFCHYILLDDFNPRIECKILF